MSKEKKEQKAQECEEETLEAEETEEQVEEEKTDKEQEKKEVEASPEEESFKERLVRLQADFANFKKRTEREKSDIYKYAAEGVMEDLLPTLDNFERALTAAETESDSEDGFCEGMKLIYTSFVETLQKHGLKEIEAEGASFDPQKHHAVMQAEVEGVEADTVVEVFQKGYSVKDKVIRPSMVKVAR
ncbi:MAG: nucleotide exchange factor GrpE [Tissierellales bacterium]|jgi:molecular chaperone GrpE|nr:nucleotide exchange factor GrpE [Tissierellales bacterium]